jgi:hypothetical protein
LSHVEGRNLAEVLQNRVLLGKLFGAKVKEVTGGWRKVHNTVFHDLYSLPCVIRVIKSRNMAMGGHVARVGGKERYLQGFWWEHAKEAFEDLVIDGKTVLKFILKK